ncbi:hypothetical protein [Mesobacterium pallidum]|uniref:hypothetical protein n=1 Tax=Mesobacterium pallidum TaxID=2872037 RepID=UPI001EE2AADC|nr:hypothetical protein [Mesobacterium pallidum]
MKRTLPFVAAALMLGATTLQANEFEPAMRSYLETEVLTWAMDPVIVARIKEQNTAHASLDQAAIDAMDAQWRKEVGAAATPTIDPVVNNAASDFLRDHVDGSVGIISEIFVMDAHGMNAAASGITSDYWQGDEDKFQQTFGVGPDAVHFGEVEFDESSQRFQAQLSITIRDPETGDAIGAMTVGLNAEALM